MERLVTKEDVLEAIRQLAASKSRNWLTYNEFFTESGITQNQFHKHFIRYNDAVAAAGLRPLSKTGRPDQQKGMRKEQLIQSANELAQKLGRRDISQVEFTKYVGISYRPIHRLFGTWDQFVQEVGLCFRPAHKTRIPDETLFEEFFRIKSEIGRFPILNELRHSKYSAGIFSQRFGTYSKFKIKAIQYGIEKGILEPTIEHEVSGDSHDQQSQKSVQHKKLEDRSVLGERIEFRSLLHAPTNELGVIFLFGIIAEEIGFRVEFLQGDKFPDCEAQRRLKHDRWQRVKIEFEFVSSNFLTHKHDPVKCDLIVCWEHDWKDCPMEVISLKPYIKQRTSDR